MMTPDEYHEALERAARAIMDEFGLDCAKHQVTMEIMAHEMSPYIEHMLEEDAK